MTTRALTWTPVRDGDRYCSSACGRGCTYAEYRAATERARDLAQKLRGWTVDVWENLGWHSEITSPCGRLHVYTEPAQKTYMAFLNHKGEGGGRFSGVATTPKEAVRLAVEQGRAELANLEALLKDLPV